MRIVPVVCAALLLCACGLKYNKEDVPLRRDVAPTRVPNQQRVVALAVDEAVEQLDFKELVDKNVDVEIDGIFPHSPGDLLDYARTQVEAKLAKSGAHVRYLIPALAMPGTSGVAIPAATPVVKAADYRVVVGVSWGGVDTRDKVTTDEDLLTKQVGLAVGGVLGGIALLTVNQSKYSIIISVASIVGSPLGAWLWSRKETPYPHTYTLIGRVRLVAQAIPTGEGHGFTTEGKGASQIVLDETSAEGFRLE